MPLLVGGLTLLARWAWKRRAAPITTPRRLPDWMSNRAFLIGFRGVVVLWSAALFLGASCLSGAWPSSSHVARIPLWAALQMGFAGMLGAGLGILWAQMMSLEKGREMDTKEHRELLDSFVWMFGIGELCLSGLMVLSALQ